jgi:hypothetical protein
MSEKKNVVSSQNEKRFNQQSKIPPKAEDRNDAKQITQTGRYRKNDKPSFSSTTSSAASGLIALALGISFFNSPGNCGKSSLNIVILRHIHIQSEVDKQCEKLLQQMNIAIDPIIKVTVKTAKS